MGPLLLLLSVLPVLLVSPVLLEEWRLSATELDLSTTTLASVRLMLRPMLSTELDTLLPLLLDTPLPPTATPRPGGCATPGLSRTPARSPTLSVCLSLSAPACPSAPPSPSPSVTPPPGPSATPSPTLLLTKCATPAQLRSALPSPSRSPSR